MHRDSRLGGLVGARNAVRVDARVDDVALANVSAKPTEAGGHRVSLSVEVRKRLARTWVARQKGQSWTDDRRVSAVDGIARRSAGWMHVHGPACGRESNWF